MTRKHSITWQPMIEKRVLVPTIQALATGAVVGACALLAQSEPSPLRTAAMLGTGFTAVTMVKLYFFPAQPQPVKAQQPAATRNYAELLESGEIGKTILQPIDKPKAGEPVVADRFPVELDKLKLYCFYVKRGAKLGKNYWTSNKRTTDPEKQKLQIFKQTEYTGLTKQLLKYGYIERKSKTSKQSGYLLTEKGYRWCVYVLSQRPTLTPGEYSAYYSEIYESSANQQTSKREAAGRG